MLFSGLHLIRQKTLCLIYLRFPFSVCLCCTTQTKPELGLDEQDTPTPYPVRQYFWILASVLKLTQHLSDLGACFHRQEVIK